MLSSYHERSCFVQVLALLTNGSYDHVIEQRIKELEKI